MDSIHHLHITNHWAIVVSAVFLWILGAAWYSPPLFAKPWMALLNIKPEPGKNKGLLAGMIASFIGDLVLSFVLWHMVSWAGAVTWSAGVFVGLLVWVGFFVAPNFPQGIYEQRPFKLFAINNGYWLVGLVVTSALLAAWR